MEKKQPQIVYSCYHSRSWQGEQFIAEHVFSFQVAGSMTMNDGNKSYIFDEGSLRLSRRNRLIKFFKQPPPNGDFKMLSVYLDQQMLRNFSLEYGYKAERHTESDPVIEIKPHQLLTGFINSLKPYEQLAQMQNGQLISLKQKEIIFILLQTNPELKDILFDFDEPGKIDLEAFMTKNYHFNVKLERFAYLTGRSLATFKRDFEKIYNLSPSRWLTQKRLQEAHYRIKQQGKSPSEVYLELGFENISHFSFAFKKMFGVAPSLV